MWLPRDAERATRLVPRARLGRSGDTTVPRGQGTHGGLWGGVPQVLLAAERGEHLGWLQDGWGWGTHGSLVLVVGACWCMGTQGCGAMGRWGYRAVRLTGCRVTDLGDSWQAVWLAGHGAGLAGVQVPCAGDMAGCHMALWQARHCCDPILGASVTHGRGPMARHHWGQPRARMHHEFLCHDAVGSLCPSSSGHLHIWGSQLWSHRGKQRLVSTVSAALLPWLLCCRPGCWLPSRRQVLLQPRQEFPAPPRPIGACMRAPAASQRGRLCHMELRALGTTGASTQAGAGTCAPWP